MSKTNSVNTEHFAASQDPATSVRASYEHHPMEDIEPLERGNEKPCELASDIALAISKYLDLDHNVYSDVEKIIDFKQLIHSYVHDLCSKSEYAIALRELINRCIESNDPYLELKSIAAAAGIPIPEESLAHLGVVHGVGRAAPSKRVRKFQKEYGISGASMNKSVSSRDTYAGTNPRRQAAHDMAGYNDLNERLNADNDGIQS